MCKNLIILQQHRVPCTLISIYITVHNSGATPSPVFSHNVNFHLPFAAAANDILQRLWLSRDSEASRQSPDFKVQVSYCSYFLYRGRDESATSELCKGMSWDLQSVGGVGGWGEGEDNLSVWQVKISHLQL